jgi:hypothetical protein
MEYLWLRNNGITVCYGNISSKLAQAVTRLTCVRQVSGSNLGGCTDSSDCGFRGFPQYLQTNTERLITAIVDDMLLNNLKIHLSTVLIY